MEASASTSSHRQQVAYQTPSRHAVLNTVELLERILFHVEWRQTFAAQRVCRHFRDVIAQSAVLRQKMFLTPCKVRMDSKPEDSGYDGRWISCFTDHEQTGPKVWRERCPLVIPVGARPGHVQDAHVQAYYYRLDLPATATRDQRESWRKVFLCNPPVKEIYAKLVCYKPGYLYEYVARVPNPDGVTIHDLFPDEFRPFFKRLKGLCECSGAYGGVPRDHLKNEIVEMPRSYFQEGAGVVLHSERSRFAFYTEDMVKMGLEYYSS